MATCIKGSGRRARVLSVRSGLRTQLHNLARSVHLELLGAPILPTGKTQERGPTRRSEAVAVSHKVPRR